MAVGFAGFRPRDFALARYNPNGTLDASFSGDGTQTTNFRRFDGVTGVAVQANGRIVAIGGTFDGVDDRDFALARYNANGTLDVSFSGDGKQTTGFGGNAEAYAVALQANSKIVATGLAPGTGGGNFALARYNTNGTLDVSFSGDGKQTTNFVGFDFANGVSIQGDGKIVAAGRTGGANFALARYNPNGSLDASFSGDGRRTTDFGGLDQAYGVALTQHGKIVAAGAGGGNFDFALARYLGT